MTRVNDPDNLSGGDLFAYEIKYTNPENTGLSTGRFNGNIAEIDWKTSTNPNDNKRRYSYLYDGLNRLQQGVYTEPGSSLVNNDHYNEYLTYDLNGNIATLKRFSKPSSGTTAEKIDDLIYDYTGNRLDKIKLPVDVVNNYSGYNALQNVITYDSNGNMINHLDKGITSIVYNILNLPSLITSGSGRKTTQTVYVYRADGTKLRKFISGAAIVSTQTVDYLDGFQYFLTNDFNTCIECPIPSELQFVPTSEGYFDFVKNKYIYNYTDHLGNTRLSYFRNGSSVEVLEENNYYPFGLKHGGYNALAGNPKYQYKYNGKELQETGFYDYGWRHYMPDIGRWMQLDPLVEDTEDPYSYVYNNPISLTDPDGRAPDDGTEDEGCCNNFGKGFKEGFVGTFEGIGNLIAHPIETIRNNGGDMLLSAAFPVSGSTQSIQAGSDLAKGDGYRTGKMAGEATAELTIMAATEGVGRGIKAFKPTSLYRGVNEGHAGYKEAVEGKATPKGGKANPSQHNAGDTNSKYTSWSKNKEVAKNYSLRPNGNGVILKKTVPAYKTVKSPSIKNVNLKQTPGKIVNEQEVTKG